MPVKEETRRQSRIRNIVRLKPEIDYDRLHSERHEIDVSGKVMDGWKVIGPPPCPRSRVPWRPLPLSGSRYREVRILLLAVGLSLVVTSVVLIVVLTLVW